MSYYVKKSKRQKGFRYAIVMDVTRNGVRTRKEKVLPEGTTKAMAEEIRLKLELQEGWGNYIDKEPLLLREYVEDIYFPTYSKQLSPTTQKSYRQQYFGKNGIKEKLGDMYLSDITRQMVQNLVTEYEDLGKSPKTIRNYIKWLSVVFKNAIIDGYLKKDQPNPCEYIRLPKMQSKEGEVYSMEQVKLMLERAKATENINMQLLIALTCLAGGLRRSELIGLRWSDISLNEDNCCIHIERAAVYVEGEVIEKGTKTAAGRRYIPIQPNGIVYNILQSARKLYMKEQSMAENFQGDNHVFILHHAPYPPVNPNRIYKMYKTFLEKECPELPVYRLHDLRHTYFTWCSEVEGFSELSIIGTGGHSSIQSTKRYQHATMQRMKADMEKLEVAFRNVAVSQ